MTTDAAALAPRADLPPEVEAAIIAAPRGCYQYALVMGRETWSGSSLKGAARKWGAKYARSRAGLLRRIAARLPEGWSAMSTLVLGGTPRRARRELVVTSPEGTTYLW